MKDIRRNLTMLCDFYELTMGNGYLKCGLADKIVYFDVFYRENPDGGGFAIAAGLEQIVNYINDLRFDEEDIQYLRDQKCFDEEFLDYLRTFRFTGDIWAVPEGTAVFPGEPILTVRAKTIEAQFIETYVLMAINHSSLIATKAARLTRAARGRVISEFGARRAHGADAAILGARAAYIGGCGSTSCTITDEVYSVPAMGTMAHSWIQMFDSEYEAFEAYCRLYPNSATLLVDTYNVTESGVPNAIKAFNEVLKPLGITKCGVRIDSGDITYLTKKVRRMLDEAGWTECRIIVSNSLDEYIIRDLLKQGAKLDAFGVGERLITSKSTPVFGGVYKLVAIDDEKGNIVPAKIFKKYDPNEPIPKGILPGLDNRVDDAQVIDMKLTAGVYRGEMRAEAGQTLTYTDDRAQPGVTYTYRVIPVHAELLDNGVLLEGKQSVQVARAKAPNSGASLWDSLKDRLSVRETDLPESTDALSLFWYSGD